MSGKKKTGDGKGGGEPKTAPGEKEKLSRLSKRHRKEARKRRRAVLVVVLALGAVLAVGALLNIPYINVAREAGAWMGERFSGPRETEELVADYEYFTDPQNGKKYQGEVSVLLGIYKAEGETGDKRTILGLALLTYDTGNGVGEVYLIPETSVAYDAAGQQTDLGRALQEEGGEDLLRSTVGNMAGSEVDYLLLAEFWEAVRLVQSLGAPPVVLAEKTVLVNPLNGETNYLVAGQEIRDADRLLFYLLATDHLEMWGAFAARLERAGDYLPQAFHLLGQEGPQGLQEAILPLGEGFRLEPGTGSPQGDGGYLASMLRSYVELDEGELAFKSVPAVEVLNGCGVPDLGKKVGDRLASLGVPLAGTGGNAKVVVDGEELNDFSHQVSTIIYRSQDPRVAAFAAYLGVLLSVDDVRSEPGPGAEIIVIAGKDLAS